MNDLVITPTELFNAVIEKLPIPEIHPLHKAMMEECCENAINSNAEKDLETLIPIVHLAMLSCDSLLKGLLKGSLESTDADFVKLNYRNQTFTIPRDSPFLKS